MIKYLEAKSVLIESLQVKFPEVVPDELEAMVTHWLHSPDQSVPLVTPPMEKHLTGFLQQFLLSDRSKQSDSTMAGLDQSFIDWGDVSFPPIADPSFTFIDLFAGIGGFRLAMQELGGKCVFSSEWDVAAKKTYDANFGETPYGDIKNIDEKIIPQHDVLCAGFPCQPFSLAGVSARNFLNTSHGFECATQGTLFFDVARIIKESRPKVVFLENVKNLVNHDAGITFSVVKKTIESLGYSFSYKLIDSSPLVPQKRVRCYMVCLRDSEAEFIFPEIAGPSLPLKSILESTVDSKYTISSKLWQGHINRTERNVARGTGFTAYCADLEKPSNTIVARYGKDGKECLIPQDNDNPRMLTPRECARLQGFPETYKIPAARTTAYRQFGNSVAVPVIRVISKAIIPFL